MRITTLELVEDSNEFSLAELDGLEPVTPFTVGVTEIKIAGAAVGVRRVDRFPAGVSLDVPQRQADNLIALGKAEAAKE